MVDSAAVAVFVEGFGAAGSKSAVLIGIADPRGPRWTPTSTCCSRPCSSRPTISCLNDKTTPRVGSQTRRLSRCVWRKRSWESRRIGGFLALRLRGWGICSRSCPSSPGTSSGGASSPRRWSGCWGSSPVRARASRTICCSSTRLRLSVPAAARRSNARRSATPPITVGARRIPGFLGVSPARDLRPRRHPTRA